MVTKPNETKRLILEAVNEMADAVKVTLGTKGRLVMYTDYRDFDDPIGKPVLTKDGVTVAREIKSDNKVKNQAMEILRSAARNTVSTSGDGPQPLYSKVLTPKGFVKMKSLQVGQEICGTNGTIQKVVGLFPKGKKEICKVIFSDGKEVECCEDHLWKVTTYSGAEKTLTTKQILDTGIYLKKSNGQKQYRFYVQKCFSEFEKNPIPIDPYLLGLLIGNSSLLVTGDIELSLSLSKNYIIENIDDSLIDTVFYDDTKSYFRVKFKDQNLINSLKDLGLYGTKTDSKFIPKIYKYNSIIVREKLLQGLLDTNGYINNKNLFEYSTVSDQLKSDFIELISSMGISYNYRYDTRLFDNDSYSNKPIHKISQLKGYKYGDKIVDIIKTGEKTEMQCIKVSNKDCLYITDNYIVTHNTSSTLILAQYLVNKGYELLNKGYDSYQINQEIDIAVSEIKNKIKEMSIMLDEDLSMLKNLASISANSEEIGNIIFEVIDELGVDCDIEVKKSKRSQTQVEVVNGMKLHKGYFAPFMCNDYTRMLFEAKDVNILLYLDEIKNYNEISQYIQASTDLNGNPIPLLIYAKDMSKTALNRLEVVLNYNPRPVIVVEHDGFGERADDIINDISALTGATIVNKESQIHHLDFDVFGKCDEIIVNQNFTSLIGGRGNSEIVAQLVKEIKEKLVEAKKQQWNTEIKFLNKRIANLTGGIAVIHVGGNTRFEMEEKYMRFDDAVLAVKSAIREGISIGGAYTWEKVGSSNNAKTHKFTKQANPAYFMVYDCVREILKQLLLNSGELNDDFLNKVRSNYLKKSKPKAYNLIDRKFYNIEDYKVFDATSVLLDALHNSSNVAKSLLAIEYSIHYDNKKY